METLRNKHKIVTVAIQNTPLEDQSLKAFLCSPLRQQEEIYTETNQIDKNNNILKISGNGFYDAFYAAYCLHGDVVISANGIWLVIAHKFNEEINKDPERYRHLFVDHQGKKTLSIDLNVSTSDWLNFPCQQNNWPKVIEMFNDKIEENTKGDISSLIKCDFSSSVKTEVVAANVCLMAQMKAYFKYEILTYGCGIQNIHFVGGVEDFEYLLDKITKLRKGYQLNLQFLQYLNSIHKIVLVFIQNMKDPQSVDVSFWNSIFDEQKGKKPGSSGMLIDCFVFKGWFKDFFGLNQIEKDKIPTFQSQAPVEVNDQAGGGKKYQLTFITEISGVEKIGGDIYKPVVQVKIHSDDNKVSQNIQLNNIHDQYGIPNYEKNKEKSYMNLPHSKQKLNSKSSKCFN